MLIVGTGNGHLVDIFVKRWRDGFPGQPVIGRPHNASDVDIRIHPAV
jgi:hypothetical protein